MAMPKGRTPAPKLPTLECSGTGCERRVQQRRPSASGRHFCDSRECQSEKQRLAYQDRTKRAAGLAAEEYVVGQANLTNFLSAAVHKPRVPCNRCGLTNGLMNYPHRSESNAPCYGLGEGQLGIMAEHIDAVWHPEDREYGEIPE